MTRTCARPGCGQPATATLAYQYATSTVWLAPWRPSADPSTYDLCRRHSSSLTVPRGWHLQDERTSAPPDARRAGVLTHDRPRLARPGIRRARLTGIFADLFYAVSHEF